MNAGISIPTGARIQTGTYTGDGNATQAITGVGFKPKFMMAYGNFTGTNILWKMTQDVLNALDIDVNAPVCAYETGNIISFNTNGFTVGNAGSVSNVNWNALGILVNWVAFA